ncbi:hypothetical protein RRG08_020400 [Elysia crispata]|uniref:HTH CENPB-type domain-containing protein n=1 Tax=Elysia crispata TaxID=231223 RepID=A0AAE0Y7G9_9GAST|nr:hypothetical protein RRG08_020400 [Elysia crispata]
MKETSNHKRQRTSTFAYVDEALRVWFKQARSNDVPISWPVLVEKGEELAKSLGYSDFKMSDGWLDRFKTRHGIVLNAVSGEAASAKKVDTTAWEAKLQTILKDFQPRDIYNQRWRDGTFLQVPPK